jgi:hypothetical protein
MRAIPPLAAKLCEASPLGLAFHDAIWLIQGQIESQIAW